MEIAEPIYVTEEMLKEWGACDQRLNATRLFPDGRIPVTPEACRYLTVEKGLDVRGWVGGVLGGRKQSRQHFHLAVEARARNYLGREEEYRHLTAKADLGTALREQVQAYYRGEHKLPGEDVRWLSNLQRMLDTFEGRPGNRNLFSSMASYFTRIRRRESQVVSLAAGTLEAFECLCEALYTAWPKRERLRDARGRFRAYPQVGAGPVQRSETRTAIDVAAEWLIQPIWRNRHSGFYLATSDSGLTW